MLNSRREKWSALCTLWVVSSSSIFAFTYGLTKTSGWVWDMATWCVSTVLWLLIFRFLAHKAGWWRMRRVWLGRVAALATYYVRQSNGWLVYALYCSDPRWRWPTRNMIATVFGVPREAVATVTDFGGPSLLLYAHPEVVEHILNNIVLACKNGVRDVILIQHTAVCKALEFRGITFDNASNELVASKEIVTRAMALVAERVPHARVWGAVLVKDYSRSPFFEKLFGTGVKFEWIGDQFPSAL